MVFNRIAGISRDSMVVVSQDQVSCDLSGESAILNLKAGVYYGLNEVGTRIWKLIQEPRRVGDLRDTILEEYEVDLIAARPTSWRFFRPFWTMD